MITTPTNRKNLLTALQLIWFTNHFLFLPLLFIFISGTNFRQICFVRNNFKTLHSCPLTVHTWGYSTHYTYHSTSTVQKYSLMMMMMVRVGGVGASVLVQFVSASRAARTRDRGLSGTLTLSSSRTLSGALCLLGLYEIFCFFRIFDWSVVTNLANSLANIDDSYSLSALTCLLFNCAEKMLFNGWWAVLETLD